MANHRIGAIPTGISAEIIRCQHLNVSGRRNDIDVPGVGATNIVPTVTDLSPGIMIIAPNHGD